MKLKMLPVLLTGLTILTYSCKTKKAASKLTEVPPVVSAEKPAPTEKTVQTAAENESQGQNETATPKKSDFKFSNIQFEFNSIVLKTASYENLDKIASEIKSNPTEKFVINGHSSAEGSPEHNKSLSIDRANAVKTYLVNAGVSLNTITTAGFGEEKPIADNSSESGRALNRRVEIKKTK